ncbi:hypothetical protein FE784_23430 [Paenibacillus hemerocallicola]|uniref:Uncharacterized protein n=1 Tax=Paenibacillus hemerocallicola TaxID=1172614 RepID=A0A5C4T453_9BACL|nr:hypothetical protein [Paenibacillus hemerocallicola]TNJ63831.1 hypothetical protein FE784_23430 [Paenibacillus hemerocallicola]
MSNSKHFVHNQFKKWKDAATQFIGHENDGENEPSAESPVIELEPEYYERCRQLAESRNTTVAAVVHYLLKQQLALKGQERIFKTNIDLIESNPLLALDALTGRRRSSHEPEVLHDEYA